MPTVELNVPDAPACPLLRLAADRHTRYTFPHPAHRCYATAAPAVVEPSHQAAYCLSLRFMACDRYEPDRARRSAARSQAFDRPGEAAPSPPRSAHSRCVVTRP